jgi:hypothetical protein
MVKIIYETSFTKVTNYKFPSHTQWLFYNILLQNVSFWDENGLLCTSSFEKIYIHECYISLFLPTLDNLQTYTMKYAHGNLLDIKINK